MRFVVTMLLPLLLASCGGSVASDEGHDAPAIDATSVGPAIDATVDATRSEVGGDTAVRDGARDSEMDTSPPTDTLVAIDTRPSCDAGATVCSGTCVDVRTDPKNCGSCGNACTWGGCCSGSCAAGCAPGMVVCGDPCTCVNTATDPSNCGACGKKCCAGTVCAGGACVTVCGAGMTSCGSSTGCPTCVDTATDPSNCGACGHACPAGSTCAAGTCT